MVLLILLLSFLASLDEVNTSLGCSELVGCMEVSAVKWLGENCDCVLHSAERDGKMLISSSDSSSAEGNDFRRGNGS